MVTIRSVESPTDLEQAANLGASTLRPNHYQEAKQFWRTAVPADPTYRQANQRVVEVDGRIVGQALIVDRTVAIGVARLRVGGISGFALLPEYQSQGHAEVLMQDCLSYMNKQRYDLSVVNAPTSFYLRYGYATAWPSYALKVKAEDVARLTSPLNIRPLAADDLPALMSLYESASLTRVGSFLRDETYWRWRLAQQRRVRVAVDGEGAVRGYVTGNAPAEVLEAIAADREAAIALLTDLGREVLAGGGSDCTISVPPDDLFARWTLELCPVDICQASRPDAGWMARFIDLPRTLAKLTEELGVRLLRSPYRDWRGRLRLLTDMGTVILGCRYSEVTLLSDGSTTGLYCRIPQARLAQLLFGYRSAFEVADDTDAYIGRDAIPLLAGLFPRATAALAGLDWF
ncbi:MAG: GNAT family N-acetyltransferase [Anaerolineae bacterium]|nr:GNAT family N-acetyltransferase [Anaerolineae bacterium]